MNFMISVQAFQRFMAALQILEGAMLTEMLLKLLFSKVKKVVSTSELILVPFDVDLLRL